MSDRLRVSVIIPAYNEVATIRTVVHRVRAVPLDTEIIAVNDSSTDDTGDILETYSKSAGIQVHHTQFGSASKARNVAFHHSRGELIKYFDADDILSPDLIEHLKKVWVAGQQLNITRDGEKPAVKKPAGPRKEGGPKPGGPKFKKPHRKGPAEE